MQYGSKQIDRTHFLLCKARAESDNVYHVALNDSNVGQMTSPEGIKLLSLAVTLLLLLCQTFLTEDCIMMSGLGMAWFAWRRTLLC